MKRTLLVLGIIVGLGALSSLAWVGVTRAADVRGGDAPSVGKSETVDGTLYISGRSVTIDGTVKGDVFCAGMDVFVTGTVEGDVICAGQFVRVTGTVGGDIRVAGQQVDVSGSIKGSATIAAQSAAIKSDTKIGRDITLGGETMRLDGEVGRDVLGGGQSIILSGTVARDVQIEAENVAVESKAKIGGDLAYRSPDKARIEDGATVSGETTYQAAPRSTKYDNNAVRLWSAIYGFGSLLLIGLAAVLIAPRWFDALGAAIRNRPVGSFGYGAAALVGTPIIAGLLMATFIGLALGFMMLFVWVAALMGAMVITAYAIGWMVVERLAWPPRGQRIASLVAGLLVLGLVGLIPILGGIVTLLAIVFGLGAMVVVLVHRLRPQQYKVTKGAKA